MNLFTFLLLFAAPLFLFSQVVEKRIVDRGLELGFFLGASTYEGDVHSFSDEELNYFSELGISFGVQVKKYLKNNVGVRLRYQYLNLTGFDVNFSQESGHPPRGFSFKSKLSEFTLLLDYEPFIEKIYDQSGLFQGGVSPYIYSGFGVSFGSVDTDYNTSSQGAALQQKIAIDEQEASSTYLAFPLGLGIKVYFTEVLSVSFEIDARLAITDYLDGVKVAGNPEDNDFYSSFGINVFYALKK